MKFVSRSMACNLNGLPLQRPNEIYISAECVYRCVCSGEYETEYEYFCVCVSIILTDIDTDTDDGTSIYCHFRECSNVPRIKCFLDDGIFITPFVV